MPRSGFEQRFATGTNLAVSTRMQGQEFSDPNDRITPNPSYLNSVNLTLSQPLLRNFGTDVNLANLRIARNQDRRALQLLRRFAYRPILAVLEHPRQGCQRTAQT